MERKRGDKSSPDFFTQQVTPGAGGGGTVSQISLHSKYTCTYFTCFVTYISTCILPVSLAVFLQCKYSMCYRYCL